MKRFSTRLTEKIQTQQFENFHLNKLIRRSLIRTFATLFVLFGIIHSANAAVTVQTIGSNDTGNNANSNTVSITAFNVTGSATFLVVGVSIESSTISVSNVTIGSTALAFKGTQLKLGTSNKPPVTIELWALVNPPSGSQTITATLSGNAKFVLGAVLFTGVDQTTPSSSFVSTSGHATPISLTVPSASGELIVDVYGRNDPSNTDPVDTTIQLEQFDTKTNSCALSMSIKNATSSSTTMDWAVTGGGNDWALGAISIRPLPPTLAHMKSFAALPGKNGTVTLKWETSYEVDNLGFNIYREQAGKMTRLTSQIIAGSALQAGAGIALTSGNSYWWTDKSTGDKSGARYWIEDIDLKGTSTMHGPINLDYAQSEVENGRAEALTLKQVGTPLANAEPESLTQTVEDIATLPKLKGSKAAYGLVSSAQASVKIAIKQTDWYRVTQPQLVAAGFRANVDPRKLQLYVDGRQVPMLVNGQADGRFDTTDSIEFYGVQLNSPTADKHVYWLVAGDTLGKRINAIQASTNVTERDSFDYTVELRERSIYFAALLNGDEENFFGKIVSPDPLNQTLSSPNFDPSFNGEAQLEISLQGVTELPLANDHQVQVALNGNPIGNLVFDGRAKGVQLFSIPQALLREQNIITLTSLSNAVDISLVDYLRLTYRHKFVADQNRLRVKVNGSSGVDGAASTVGGFTSANIRVFDITDPDSPGELLGSVVSQAELYSVSVKLPDVATHTLLAIEESQIKAPASIKLASVSNLRSKSNKVDMLVITHGDFAESLKPLVDLRKSQGLQAMVVDVENIYDQFSFGQKHSPAIKDFLAYASSAWKKAPQFVLFVGDASTDPKNYLGFGDLDFMPTKLVDTAVFQTASDDWFADFNNDGIPELFVGRLAGRSAGEISQIVSKIVAYDNTPPLTSSAKKALLISDINDGFNFEASTLELQSGLPSRTLSDVVLRSQNSDDQNKANILAAINSGQTVVNYLGHGSVGLIRGNLLTNNDAAAMTNANNLSLFVMMTCLNGLFEEPTGESLAEALLKAEHGGAVAVWASSGICPPGTQASMNQELIKSLFDSSSKPLTIGEAAAKAKSVTTEMDVRRTWILFGDPSMKLR